MTTAVARQEESPATVLEKVVIGGDLSKLQPAERLEYYAKVCESVGLNPLTQPFEYITLNGKLRLYAKRDATDQLRANKGISIQIVGRDLVGDIFIVTARATMPGREDESTGAVNIKGKAGDDLANAYMKAETKAKRRVTLSIAGLGLLDESELEDIDPTTAAEPQRSENRVVSMPQALSEKAAPAKEAAAVDLSQKLKPGQVKIVQTAIDRTDGKVTTEALCKHFGIGALPDLPFAKVNEALKWITDQGEAE